MNGTRRKKPKFDFSLMKGRPDCQNAFSDRLGRGRHGPLNPLDAPMADSVSSSLRAAFASDVHFLVCLLLFFCYF